MRISDWSSDVCSSDLQQYTHKFETVLAQVRDGDKPLTEELLATLFRAFDLLTDHVSAIKGECGTPDDVEMSRLLEDIAESVASPSNVEEAVTAEEPALPELALPEITGLEDRKSTRLNSSH